ncbi:MAG TPA: hypothetical protein VKF59_09480 [Candidatus Dormibacteraeota bacterium]|nr:hypothetical protein [Candidatus Dormibacteraeota bacterium]
MRADRYQWIIAGAAAAVLAAVVTVGTIAAIRQGSSHGRGVLRAAAGTEVHSPRATAAPSAGRSVEPRLRPGQTQPSLPSGVLNTRVGPFPLGVFTVRNAWRGQVGSRFIWVYAGTTPASDAPTPRVAAAGARPALRLYAQDPGDDEPATDFLGIFYAQGADGPLSVASASGNVLTLKTDGGAVYHFDLEALRFV